LQTIKGYELGHREPGATALTAIATTGVNINWLLSGQGPMRNEAAAAPPVAAGVSGSAHQVAEQAAPPYGQAANSASAIPPGLAPFDRRIGALLGILDGIPTKDLTALLDEFAARAADKKQMSELQQAVRDLTAASSKKSA
jgi:hypothetical protein